MRLCIPSVIKFGISNVCNISDSCSFRLSQHSLPPPPLIWGKEVPATSETHLIDQAYTDSFAHGWNFEIASLLGQSPCDRSSWSWKQWQAPGVRWSAHRQWHTRTLLFFPTHLLACKHGFTNKISLVVFFIIRWWIKLESFRSPDHHVGTITDWRKQAFLGGWCWLWNAVSITRWKETFQCYLVFLCEESWVKMR